ncbi:uncharacterized protein TNCV_1334521 [Trichonephila clavipes]|nr:uncharacterized protein TNCV_1334521 [Trichonephila clavipes]
MPSIGGYHPYGLARILTGLTHPIELVWDMLGPRIAARQPPPTCLPELRRALLDEWVNIRQDQIDNFILRMPRCCKACVLHPNSSICRLQRISWSKMSIGGVKKLVTDFVKLKSKFVVSRKVTNSAWALGKISLNRRYVTTRVPKDDQC